MTSCRDVALLNSSEKNERSDQAYRETIMSMVEEAGSWGAVSASALLQRLDQQHRERLFCMSTMRDYRAKTAIFHEGDPSKDLLEVIEGVVKLYRLMPDGRRQITAFAYPGQIFGLDRNGVYSATAEAVVDVKLCGYPLAKLDRIVGELPEFALGLLAMVTSELVAAQGHMMLLGRKSAVEKIASFLLGLSDRRRGQGLDPTRLPLPMKRADIGDYLGLSLETVSRTVTQLRQMGVIAFDQHNDLRIRDSGRLRTLAEDDEGCLAA